MIAAEARCLCDLVLADAHARGVRLEVHTFRFEQYRPVLRLRLGGRILQGCHIDFPSAPRTPYGADVITVHGSGHRASRMWPRKIDGSFNITAVTDHLLALVEHELSRPVHELRVPSNVSAATSGLHVVHLAGVRLGVLPSRSTTESLLARVESKKAHERIAGHLVRDGLSDADMRALGDAAGMFVGRSNKTDDIDPLEPINDRILTAFMLGRAVGKKVEQRFVLMLDHRGDVVELADPAGGGLTHVTPSELKKAWMLGARRQRPWMATISAG